MKKTFPRLAVISYHACPLAAEEGKQTGGLNVYVLETAKALGIMGFHLDLFTRSQSAKQPYNISIAPNVLLHHIPAGPERPLSKNQLLPYVSDFAHGIIHYYQSQSSQPQLIHAHYYLSGLAAVEVKKVFTEIPMMQSFHTLALMKNLVARSADELESERRIDAEQNLSQSAQMIFASSSTDAAYIKYLYAVPQNKIILAPPGVDLNIFKPQKQSTARALLHAESNCCIILAVGRVEPLKGFDLLMYAVKILLEKRKDFKKKLQLWIVGAESSQKPLQWSNELKKLDALRKTLGLAPSVRFLTQQKQADLANYYNAADVVVMPSHYESFGMVALEAMACNTPVIASNVSGISSVMDDELSGVLTTVNNPLLLAQQLEHVLTDESVRSKLQTEALKTAKKYSWKNTATILQQAYQKVYP